MLPGEELAAQEQAWPVTYVTLALVRPGDPEFTRALYFVTWSRRRR
ncbi:hypothetical protein [Streptomyces marincola]|nr:hypothetical protein [Streptomyces marincola]